MEINNMTWKSIINAGKQFRDKVCRHVYYSMTGKEFLWQLQAYTYIYNSKNKNKLQLENDFEKICEVKQKCGACKIVGIDNTAPPFNVTSSFLVSSTQRIKVTSPVHLLRRHQLCPTVIL